MLDEVFTKARSVTEHERAGMSQVRRTLFTDDHMHELRTKQP